MELFKHHYPRTYPTVAAQVARLKWMLKQCRNNGWIHLAKLIEQQIDEVKNGLQN